MTHDQVLAIAGAVLLVLVLVGVPLWEAWA